MNYNKMHQNEHATFQGQSYSNFFSVDDFCLNFEKPIQQTNPKLIQQFNQQLQLNPAA